MTERLENTMRCCFALCRDQEKCVLGKGYARCSWTEQYSQTPLPTIRPPVSIVTHGVHHRYLAILGFIPLNQRRSLPVPWAPIDLPWSCLAMDLVSETETPRLRCLSTLLHGGQKARHSVRVVDANIVEDDSQSTHREQVRFRSTAVPVPSLHACVVTTPTQRCG